MDIRTWLEKSLNFSKEESNEIGKLLEKQKYTLHHHLLEVDLTDDMLQTYGIQAGRDRARILKGIKMVTKNSKTWPEIISLVSSPKSFTPRSTLPIDFGTVTIQQDGVRIDGTTFLTHRNDTIGHICNFLRRVSSVLVRSPPYSGKTSLCQLLSHRFAQVLDENVCHLSMLGLKDFQDISSLFLKKTGRAFVEWATLTSPTIIIVDELQVSYNRRNDAFWEWIKDIQNINQNVKVICFSTYNSPRQGEHSTPFQFPCVLGLKDILLSISEFNELTNDFNERNNKDLFITEDLKATIKEICSLHTGFTMRVIYLFYSFNQSDTEFVKYLRTRKFLLDIISLRGVPCFRDINERQKSIIKHLFYHSKYIDLEYASTRGEKGLDDDLLSLIKHGAVVPVDEEYEYCFSCPVVCYTAMISLADTPRELPIVIPDLESLLLMAIPKFNSATLQNTFGKSVTDNLNLEAVWAMEFYRVLLLCLGNDTFVSPQVIAAPTPKDSGWVDFVVNSSKWWLIELLREGTRKSIEEYLSRFDTKKGKYRSLMKENQKWAVIDFRAKLPEIHHPHLYSVVYNSDYTLFTIIRNSSALATFQLLK